MSSFKRKYATLLVTGTTAIYLPVIKRGVVDFALSADWPSPVAADFKVKIGAGSPASITNVPTFVSSGNAAYLEVLLTAAELTAKQTIVTISDAATKLVEDQMFIVETYGHPSAMYQSDLSGGRLTGSVVSGGSTTGFVSDRTETATDYWKDTFVKLTSGAMINQVRKCTGYNGSTKAFAFADTPFSGSPANAVTFEIVND